MAVMRGILRVPPSMGRTKGGYAMGLKGLAITMGIGAAAGAVGILMMSRNNPTRKLAAQAANKVEDAAQKVTDMITEKMDF